MAESTLADLIENESGWNRAKLKKLSLPPRLRLQILATKTFQETVFSPIENDYARNGATFKILTLPFELKFQISPMKVIIYDLTLSFEILNITDENTRNVLIVISNSIMILLERKTGTRKSTQTQNVKLTRYSRRLQL